MNKMLTLQRNRDRNKEAFGATLLDSKLEELSYSKNTQTRPLFINHKTQKCLQILISCTVLLFVRIIGHFRKNLL